MITKWSCIGQLSVVDNRQTEHLIMKAFLKAE